MRPINADELVHCQIKEAQNINTYFVERMVEVAGRYFFDMLSEEFELVEKTITPNGETITKVYTIEQRGAHSRKEV